jgi:hypothetical protein
LPASGATPTVSTYVTNHWDKRLERNSPKDREDVAFLAESLHLSRELLRERYQKELRPNLANESRQGLTLELWLDACFEPHLPKP